MERMVNAVVRNPFNLTPSQILAFGRLCGLTNGSRLPAARLVGNAIDEGLTPTQAIDQVRAARPQLFFRQWSEYWAKDGQPFDGPHRG
jgi:hypothetical protein